MEAILDPLRLRGIRVLSYLNDWNRQAHTELVTGHLHRLGLSVNHANSQLTPECVE
ncbi:UNVERIFIED_CONTAM: hypothetical protein FKN15_045539 [Acipenser sinensis]